MTSDILSSITEAVAALDEKAARALVEDAIGSGSSSVEITRAVEQGMQRVGERYEQGDIFLAGLIMAGEIFRSVLELIRPGLETELSGDAKGKVLLGTVSGDIHDIGKNMASLALRSFGFTVKDLGVNVPPEHFLEEAKRFKPDIVGLSGLLYVAFTAMRDTVNLFHESAHELPGSPMIIVGGCTIDEPAARYIGADFWTTDAMEGVRICQRFMEGRESDAK